MNQIDFQPICTERDLKHFSYLFVMIRNGSETDFGMTWIEFQSESFSREVTKRLQIKKTLRFLLIFNKLPLLNQEKHVFLEWTFFLAKQKEQHQLD